MSAITSVMRFDLITDSLVVMPAFVWRSSVKIGDLIRHKWGNDVGIVVGRPDPARQPPPNNWYVMFGSKKVMVHEISCEVLNESR